ncbi:hypothetical protein [Bradyrhizobium sp. AZCC 2289]
MSLLKAKFDWNTSADNACSRCFKYSFGKVTNQPTTMVEAIITASAG